MAIETPDVHSRVVVLGLVFTGIALMFAGRLCQLQIIEGAHYAQAVDQARVITEIIQPRRGRILDRNGAPIADTRLVYDAAVVFTDLEVPTRMRRAYTLWQLDEQALSALLADLTGRVKVPPGTNLRDLVVNELSNHPATAVRSGPRRGNDELGMLVLPKDSLNPFRSDDDASEAVQLAEGDLLSEDPLAALEREVHLAWNIDATVISEDTFQLLAAILDREFAPAGGSRVADLLDPFARAFTIALPTGMAANPQSQPPTREMRVRLLSGDQRLQAELALARAIDSEPYKVRESLTRALATARGAHPAPPSPVFFAPRMQADIIAPRLPRGTVMQQVAVRNVPGARERILLIQGDPPDGEGLYTSLTRRIAANLGLDALSLQAQIEAHAKALSPQQAEQAYRKHVLVLDAARLTRLADGLTRELTAFGKPVTRLDIDRLLAQARRTADQEYSGQTRRDPLPLFSDIPQAFAIRCAGRDSEPPRDLRKIYDDADADLPGLVVATSTGRAYPFGDTLCHTLGTIGHSAGDQSGPPVGKWGLEQLYDDRLRGLPGTRMRLRTAEGTQQETLDLPLDGQDVTTEIDLETQTIAEDSLEHAYDLAQVLGSATARMEAARKIGLGRSGLVLLDVQTGGILTMASNPRYSYEELRSNYQALVKDPSGPLFDHAAIPEQPPGSSFKILTALTCLEYGVINPGEEIYCQGYMAMSKGRKILSDHAPAGKYNLAEAIQVSSNVYFATIGAKAGPDRLAEIADKIGLGRRNALDVQQQRPGILPSRALIEKIRPSDPHWRTGDTWNMSIGQFATASPLQCAVIAATVANGGHIVKPFLVRPATQPEVIDLHIRKEWLADIRDGMERVTANLDHSTAKLLVLQGSAAGIKVAAKTGTAEWGTAAQRQSGACPDHAWMIGYAPADNPTVAFACFIHSGTFGGQACTPVVKRVLEAYFAKYGRDGHTR